ncbi:DNA translocase FtsK, partial [Candidatus Microgenomates bacterium]|nr:DNA translocase FtsK [Candidatus Microgenomates bacterium]
RMQGPFLTEKEVHDLVSFLKNQAPPVHYTEEITSQEASVQGGRGGTGAAGGGGSDDPLFKSAIEIIHQSDKASASLLQRKLSIGYARAARLLDQLEEAGYVGPGTGSKPREVLRRASPEGTVE